MTAVGGRVKGLPDYFRSSTDESAHYVESHHGVVLSRRMQCGMLLPVGKAAALEKTPSARQPLER